MESERPSCVAYFFAILITVPVLIHAHPENQLYLSFGNYCGRNTIGNSAPCDFKSLHGCNPHGICRCIEPRIMSYNGTSCVVLAGESCLPSEKVWLFDNTTIYQRADYYFPCVQNSFCNLVTKTCDCLPDFYKGADLKCSPKLHGTACQTEETVVQTAPIVQQVVAQPQLVQQVVAQPAEDCGYLIFICG
ncbi:unnamed protein product [Orchesella dallaii]|uniref:EB domain-containing protein n=1 Tax=Orchesella dallaii TaxID=48710 RepID=A0ABP1PSM1_9HEXA